MVFCDSDEGQTMQGLSWFFLVCSICYLILLGLEYSKYVKGQNWLSAKAKVERSINGLPLTKFEPNRLNILATVVNWSFIEYNYSIGEGFYQNSQEMGPHLTIFDYMVEPLALRYGEGAEMDIKYNPHNPKESTFGFEVFRPVETFGGTAGIFLILGLITMYLGRIVSTAHERIDPIDLDSMGRSPR